MSWHHLAVTLVVEVVLDEQGCFALCLQAIPKHPHRGNFQPSIQMMKRIKDYMSCRRIYLYTRPLLRKSECTLRSENKLLVAKQAHPLGTYSLLDILQATKGL
jgi:hypothetical protein